jgi:hypothetical protein
LNKKFLVVSFIIDFLNINFKIKAFYFLNLFGFAVLTSVRIVNFLRIFLISFIIHLNDKFKFLRLLSFIFYKFYFILLNSAALF